MRKKTFAFLGLILGSLVLGGCSEGDPIPPSKGGAAARDMIEYPLGPPPASKSSKAKKAVKTLPGPPPGTVVH
jgi:hypothetical protein